ncbi:HNH endonuclease family protein [Planomonospora corallina]|uniref:HNH endonuclease family protein n=1 Tax=Planomonospora corallina TaxID=1806052 RepID=A0ABV8I5G8_9ACTN
MRTDLGRAAAAASLVLALAGCGPAGDPSGDSPVEAGKPAAEALKDLERLPVKGRAPMTGFDRDEFGPAWADVDRNGCDTRNDILKRDLEGETFREGTHDCIVLTGTLHDPYSGRTIEFERGQKTSMAVQIDHVVALADAWQKGAQRLGEERRRQLANDPLNLLAVDGPLNGQKSAADAATWLPPRRAYRCPYVTRQIQVKAKYELWVTAAEKEAMERVLKSC